MLEGAAKYASKGQAAGLTWQKAQPGSDPPSLRADPSTIVGALATLSCPPDLDTRSQV